MNEHCSFLLIIICPWALDLCAHSCVHEIKNWPFCCISQKPNPSTNPPRRIMYLIFISGFFIFIILGFLFTLFWAHYFQFILNNVLIFSYSPSTRIQTQTIVKNLIIIYSFSADVALWRWQQEKVSVLLQS